MSLLFITSLLLITLLSSGALVDAILLVVLLIIITFGPVVAIRVFLRLHYNTVEGLRTENKELRDRLYQKNALPPSGVDLTEKYEARQERINSGLGDRPVKPKALGPIEQLESDWTEKDRRLVERKNIDATRGRLN